MIRLLPLIALVACTPVVDDMHQPSPLEIRYEAGPCFGRCPMYAVTVPGEGGRATFEGKRFTAVAGTRSFSTTAAQAAAFRKALDEALAADPKDFEPGGKRCQMQATDHPSVTLTIHAGKAAPRTVRFDYGCRDPQNTALFDGLRRAPEALPIAHLVGKR